MSLSKPTRTICATAAAGIAACSLAGVAEQAKAEVVWTPGPAGYVGDYQTAAGFMYDFSSTFTFGIDFDNDGLDEFQVFYYHGFWIDSERSLYVGTDSMNLDTDIVASSLQPWGPGDDRWEGTIAFSEDLEGAYQQASAFEPLPRDNASIASLTLYGTEFSTDRHYLSGVFTGGDGGRYIAYLDMQVIPDSLSGFTNGNLAGDGVLTIYGLGYAPIPEPGSFALLGISGVAMLCRRRRL